MKTSFQIKQEENIHIEDNQTGNNVLPATTEPILTLNFQHNQLDLGKQHIIKRTAPADTELQRVVHTEHDEATSKTYKVTRDIETTPSIIPTATGNEVGGISEMGVTSENTQMLVIY